MFDTDVYLVGASGGVYALLAAHLANVLLVRFFFKPPYLLKNNFFLLVALTFTVILLFPFL